MRPQNDEENRGPACQQKRRLREPYTMRIEGVSKIRLYAECRCPSRDGSERWPTKWKRDAEVIQACNCAYGCPCNFNGHPPTGNCEAFVGHHIRKGMFGETSLDGVHLPWATGGPKPFMKGTEL